MDLITVKKKSKNLPKDGLTRDNITKSIKERFKDGFQLEDFSEPGAMLKSIMLIDDKAILEKSYKNVFGEQIPIDAAAEVSEYERSKDLDFGFLKNGILLACAYAYARTFNVNKSDHGYLADSEYWEDKVKELEYGVNLDGYVFDNKGEMKQPKDSNIRSGPVEEKTTRKRSKDPDEIDLEVEMCKGDYDKLVEVAVSYGITKETCAKYKHFADNDKPGLLAMNIKNRIREKQRKDAKKKEKK